ncbi:MAG: hypothetical protein CVU38_04065 [Chloroflexi bacterium HGW-Chloroflexi-1]|nr:MAG: hypothetical protein CVU38_04065 [Chloroflexi bacterium HGW-Chloroflexi-1]
MPIRDHFTRKVYAPLRAAHNVPGRFPLPRTAGWLLLIVALALAAPLAGQAARNPRANAEHITVPPANGPQASGPLAVTWTDFTPTGWATTMPTTSSVTAHAPGGLDPDTAAYAVSTDTGDTWSTWSTAGLTVNGAVSTTQTITVTGLTLPDSATANLIRFQIEEVDGALETSPDYVIKADSTPPGTPQNLQATPATWTKTADFTVTWTNPADVSAITGAWYKLDQPPTAANDGIFVSATGSIPGIAPAADGAHPIYVWLQDELGRANHAAAATTTLNLDRTPPSPPSGLQGNPARTWTNVNRFSETWTNPPDLSGIVGAYYLINRPGQFPTDGIFVSTTTSLQNIEAPADGKHDLYIWLMDAAGNVNQNNRNIDPQVFWYDSTPPVSSVTPDPPMPAGGWYSTTVTAVFSAVDGPGGSGVEAVHNRVDNTGWSTLPSLQVIAEGRHPIDYYATDLAGNPEISHTVTVALDFTAPTVALAPQRPPPASGWYTAPVTLTLNVTDTLSGSPVGYYRLNDGAWQTGAQIQIAVDGAHQIDYYGQDAAGNRSSTRTTEVKMDATPPATAYLIDGAQGQNGWYTSPLTIRLIPADSGSGVTGTFYRIDDGAWQTGAQFQLTVDGTYNISFYSVDTAGNKETGFPVQIRLDTAAPGAPTAIQTNPDGWSRVNRFHVQWANPTDLSGIAGVYYRLDREPTAPEDGILSPLTNRLDNLTVPTEGTHRLYLWLRDGAGNTDHRNRALAPLLRYDVMPPTTTLRIQGLAGTAGWYRSSVTLTLDALDAHSGVMSTRYRLDENDWITGTSLIVTTPDKYVLDFASEDAAGNVETTHQVTLRIDPNPPAAPIDLRAEPGGWQHYNSFRLLWQEPLDQSGIAGVYVRFGSPPTNPTDGTFYPANEVLHGLQAPGEGQHGVYVWLRDGAGNSDHTTAVALPGALWYDGIPPSTTVTVTGNLGQNGWYLGPVSFTMAATDSASGVAETRWQLDGASWTVGTALTVTADGRHTTRISSIDNAGNLEADQVYPIAIDQQPPVVRMGALSRYQAGPSFAVAWNGFDPGPGAGLADFDVQVRDGWGGAWQPWLTGTTLTEAVFDGLRGHTYFFRVRARDFAGNRQVFTGDETYAVVEAVRNGSFDTGNFSEWATSGLLRKAVVPIDGPAGTTVLAARLGTPEYGPSTVEPGQVPVGNAAISQTLTVPPLDQVARPTLVFWYRVFSYDVLYSQRLQRYVDAFEASLDDATGQPLVLLLRDGNATNEYGTLHDTGWKAVMLDLTPYAGRTVQLVFANYNREDNLFNTWSFVDGIQVQDWPYNQRRHLPLVTGGQGAAAAAAAAATAIQPQIAPAIGVPEGKR